MKRVSFLGIATIGLLALCTVPAFAKDKDHHHHAQANWKSSQHNQHSNYQRSDYRRDEWRDRERREREHRERWRREQWRRGHERHEQWRDSDDRRPPGWDHGKKTGWRGGDMPPGQAKKQGYGPQANAQPSYSNSHRDMHRPMPSNNAGPTVAQNSKPAAGMRGQRPQRQ